MTQFVSTPKGPKRSLLTISKSQMQAEIVFLNESIKSKSRWIKSAVDDIEREVAAGTLYPSTNLTKQAAELDMLYTRLRYATDTLETLEALELEPKQ